MIKKQLPTFFAAGILILLVSVVFGMDCDVTRRTLVKLRGFFVVFEELQPNFKQYIISPGITKEQLQQEIVLRLQKAGIEVYSQEQWYKAQGRPVLYININTHTEGANIAYSIRVEVRQVVFTDASHAVKTLAGTWGVNITGIAKQGKLDIVRQDLLSLIDQFIEAYRAVNGKERKK